MSEKLTICPRDISRTGKSDACITNDMVRDENQGKFCRNVSNGVLLWITLP